jgi:GDPmannose 4,6-dehydratase
MPCAFITGISGQDGSFLAELLLEKGYIVYGMVRRSSNMTNLDRLTAIRSHPNLHIHYGDITDLSSIIRILNMAYQTRADTPLEIYNLAAQSHVRVSFDTPMYTAQSDAIGTLNMLEAIVQLPDHSPSAVRFYQASTSELFGCTPGPQNELTLMQPQSPYGVAKLYAYWIVNNYRNIYKGFFVNGILFNHESERRAENFVTRKITQYVAKYAHKKTTSPLRMGNLYSRRDWGYARDYVEAMHLMLQHPTPHDLVIATGECHTVKEFIEAAFRVIGVTIDWEGNGVEEIGIDRAAGREADPVVVIDPIYFRPTEVNHLLGDASKARTLLDWEPKHTFDDLVRLMVDRDLVV